MSASVFEFEWITDWEPIYSNTFQEKWLGWMETASNSHVFFHPALCMAWIETYRPLRNIKPMFCIAKLEDTTIFLPLVIWGKNWKNAFQKVIVPVGYSDFDYHDPLISNAKNNEETLNLFFNELIVELKKHFDFDQLNINGLRTELNESICTKEKDFSPFANIIHFQDGEDFLLSLKTKLRGDIRRQMRRLNEVGAVSLMKYDGTKPTSQTFKTFLRLHTERWPNAYKAPLFHQNLIDAGLKSGMVHFSELKVGDKTISWHLGFQFKKIFYYYMPAVDTAWENYSPGKIHLFKLVEEAINNKLEVFDHLRGDENYKTGWTNNIQYLFQVNLNSNKVTSKIKSKAIQLKQQII